MRTVSILGLACGLAFVLGACGGSDDGGGGTGGATAAGTGASGMTATGGTGGMGGMSAGTGGTGGVPPMMMPMTMVPMMMDMPMTMTGMGEEGTPCMPGMPSCNMGLVCSTIPDPFSGVCGRPCTEATMAMDCTMPNEVCGAYDAMGEAVCIDLIPAWDVYRFQDTSGCEMGTSPVGLSDPNTMQPLPGGICLQLCALEGTDPMTLPMEVQAEISACAGGQSCLADIITTADMLPIGACGSAVARGEDCDFNAGILCEAMEDVCAPSDPMRLDSPAKCYQDCTMTGTTCDAGECTEALDEMGMVLGSYCLTP
jgi:hypothetical protein